MWRQKAKQTVLKYIVRKCQRFEGMVISIRNHLSPMSKWVGQRPTHLIFSIFPFGISWNVKTTIFSSRKEDWLQGWCSETTETSWTQCQLPQPSPAHMQSRVPSYGCKCPSTQTSRADAPSAVIDPMQCSWVLSDIAIQLPRGLADCLLHHHPHPWGFPQAVKLAQIKTTDSYRLQPPCLLHKTIPRAAGSFQRHLKPLTVQLVQQVPSLLGSLPESHFHRRPLRRAWFSVTPTPSRLLSLFI